MKKFQNVEGIALKVLKKGVEERKDNGDCEGLVGDVEEN